MSRVYCVIININTLFLSTPG